MSTFPACRPARYSTEDTIEPIASSLIVPDDHRGGRTPYLRPPSRLGTTVTLRHGNEATDVAFGRLEMS
jgi:hypothetical protein